MKYKSFSLISKMIFIFVVIQLFGIFVGNYYFSSDLPYNIESPDYGESSPLFFITMIILATVVFLIFIKLKLNFIINFWMFIAFLIVMSISLSVFLDSLTAFLISLTLLIISSKEDDSIIKSISAMLIFPGVVVIFVPMFGIYTFFLVLGLISVYDFVSVFITKHMITLAKSQLSSKFFPGIVVRDVKEKAMLGGGDVLFPMMLSIILLRDFSINLSLLCVFLSSLALLSIYVLGKKKEYYPAMPIISAFLLPILFLV